jgi:hypothetical protein
VVARQVNPNQVAWSVRNWCADADLGRAYVYELLAAKKLASVKVGGKRLITTPPATFLKSLSGDDS